MCSSITPQRNMLTPILAAAAGCLLASGIALAQGQDSTPAERNLRVMAELLPGEYDNANQHYFDRRRQLAEADQHARIHTTITRVTAPAFGEYVFLWINAISDGDAQRRSYRIATLSADGADDEVVMRHYLGKGGVIEEVDLSTLEPSGLQRTAGCDYYFKRRADQFRGAQRPGACRFDWQGQAVYTDNTIELATSSLWFVDHKFLVANGQRITGVGSGEPFWLERARIFHCYVDMPGVGGGRDIPFERYDDITLHDKGDVYWFTTRDAEAREIGIMLQAVTWHVLNEANGNFNRNSLVLYTMEKLPDGSIKEHGYAFTDSTATRIGNNMKWLLANCAITPRDAARPEM